MEDNSIGEQGPSGKATLAKTVQTQENEAGRGFLRYAKGFGFLTLGRVVGDLSTFVMFVLLSRVFGAEGIGLYSFAMSIGAFCFVLVDFGLYEYSVKHLSRSLTNLVEIFGRILACRLIFVGVASLIIGIALVAAPFPWQDKLVIAVIAEAHVIYSIVYGCAGVFVALQSMHKAALVEVSLRTATAVFVIAITVSGGSLVAAVSIIPVVYAVHAVGVFWKLRLSLGPIAPSLSLRGLGDLIRSSVPHSMNQVLRYVSMRSDIFLLGIILGVTATGIYNAGYRIVFFLVYPMFIASVAVFPAASQLFENSREQLVELYSKVAGLIILISVPAAFGLWLIADQLIPLIFGGEFDASVTVLRYLVWILPLMGLSSISSKFLAACDRQVRRTLLQGASTAINLIALLLLIPLLGAEGAAIAVVISQASLLGLFLVSLHRLLGPLRIGRRLTIATVGSLAFFVPFFIAPAQSLFLVVPCSVVVYGLVIALFSDVRNEELKTLASLLGRIPWMRRTDTR